MFKIAFLAGLSVAAVVLAAASSVGPLGTGTKAEAQEAATFNIGSAGAAVSNGLPSRVTVTTGTTVEWTVTGRAPHTVTSEGCFDSRIGDCTFDTGAAREDFLRADTDNASFSFTFDEPGVYPFYCRLHGAPGDNGQFGVIVVYEPGQNAPAGRYFASQTLLDTIAAEKAAEDAAITPPSTGDGGLVDSCGPDFMAGDDGVGDCRPGNQHGRRPQRIEEPLRLVRSG